MIKISATSKGIPLLNLNDVADITQVNNSLNKIDELLGDKTALEEHVNKKVSTVGGVHGLEYLEEDEEDVLRITKSEGQTVDIKPALNADSFFRSITDKINQCIEKVGTSSDA